MNLLNVENFHLYVAPHSMLKSGWREILSLLKNIRKSFTYNISLSRRKFILERNRVKVINFTEYLEKFRVESARDVLIMIRVFS